MGVLSSAATLAASGKVGRSSRESITGFGSVKSGSVRISMSSDLSRTTDESSGFGGVAKVMGPKSPGSRSTERGGAIEDFAGGGCVGFSHESAAPRFCSARPQSEESTPDSGSSSSLSKSRGDIGGSTIAAQKPGAIGDSSSGVIRNEPPCSISGGGMVNSNSGEPRSKFAA